VDLPPSAAHWAGHAAVRAASDGQCAMVAQVVATGSKVAHLAMFSDIFPDI
jgi:hypothetical protein